ncbi:MAG: hypothetical protein ACXAC5_03675 [Promethearchaeota archaeon]
MGLAPEEVKDPISEMGQELEETAAMAVTFVEDSDGLRSHNSDLLCENGKLEDENAQLKAKLAALVRE